MTTNVTDLIAGTTATDSRWSTEGSNFVLYADDTGFEKIAFNGGLLFAFAGNASLIESWKAWIKADFPGLPDVPKTQKLLDTGGAISMSVCCVHIERREIIINRGCSDHDGEAYFAGSGTISARKCWVQNRDAIKAVESAKNMDLFSGGTVRYLEFSTQKNNVVEKVDIPGLHSTLIKKGTVMYPANQKQANAISMPVKEAAELNPEVAEIVKQLEMGARSLSAPCEAMLSPWTDEEREKCGLALAAALGR